MAGLSGLAGTVAKELEDSTFMEWFTCVDGALGIDLLSASATHNMLFNDNVELSDPSLAYMGAGSVRLPHTLLVSS